jgi:sRNA-binding carbon storage regulator CsrA
MLVLRRKRGQRIILQNSITKEVIAEVVVTGILGNEVRIGIEASKDKVDVNREEIKLEKDASKIVLGGT